MKLADWLKSEGKTLDWLAGELGCSVSSAHRLAQGEQNAPMSTLVKIETLTGGHVTATEMIEAFRENWGAEAA